VEGEAKWGPFREPDVEGLGSRKREVTGRTQEKRRPRVNYIFWQRGKKKITREKGEKWEETHSRSVSGRGAGNLWVKRNGGYF